MGSVGAGMHEAGIVLMDDQRQSVDERPLVGSQAIRVHSITSAPRR
jgi:hypothetical protein